jgi:hypothetical protein
MRHGHDNLLGRISMGMRENATKLNCLDLERLGRRAKAESQLHELLTGLKDRILWKAAVRTQSVFEDRWGQLPDRAAY